MAGGAADHPRLQSAQYSIFREGAQVFAYFEYIGDDYEADMEKMARDEATRRWWTHTKPCFQKFSVRADSEFYAD